MITPIDGYVLYTSLQPIVWANQGRGTTIGSSFTTVAGKPSFQLQSSTNATMGYFNGQMLAYSAGDGAGGFAGQTAGALINFDPNSSDTGQAVWIGMIIADAGLHSVLPLGMTYPASSTIIASVPLTGWSFYVQSLYASGTPATDGVIVQAALTAYGIKSYSQVALANNTSALIFNY